MRRRFLLAAAVVAAGIAAGSSVTPAEAEAPDDVRVAPLLQTEWNQSSDQSGDDAPCYNYYTPDNMPCGCVATAVAQIMRHHRFPTEPVEPGSYACRVRSPRERVVLTMQGGLYAWDDMPFVPSEGTSPIQRQAIGKLTSDVGIACQTVYGEKASSAQGHLVATALTERFGYGSAVASAGEKLSAEVVRSVLIANLDAGLPVLVGVQGKGGAHAVVADGYGYSHGTLCVHFNLGRGGRGDGWYVPPKVAEFDTIRTLVYNISPSGVQPTPVIDAGEASVQSASVGVRFDAQVVSGAGSQAKVSAKGLPRGLRLANGWVSGVPMAAGRTASTLTVKDASGVRSVQVTFDVRPLASWAKGSFVGAVVGAADDVRGLLSLTVSAAGKLSGRFDDRGTNWTVTAASFAEHDAAGSVYAAEAVARCTRNAALRRSFRIEIGACDSAVGELVGASSADGTVLYGRQNLWSDAYRAIGRELFRTGKKAGRTYELTAGTCGLAEGESLRLTVSTSGKVRATGVFPREVVRTDAHGKKRVRNVVCRPSCATVVVPLTPPSGGAADFAGVVYVRFLPSVQEGFAGYAACVPLR